MKKRIALIVLLCVTLLMSGGCDLWSTLESVAARLEIYHFESEKYLEQFENNWSYRHLSADMQATYGDLYTAVTDGFETDCIVTTKGDNPVTGEGVEVRLSHTLSPDEVSQLFQAFLYDNPQFFYLDRHYGMNGSQIGDKLYYDRMTLLYSMTAAERKLAKEEIEKVKADILQKAAGVSDEFERELLLHDWLAAHCTYDYAEEPPVEAYTAYGALVKGVAVCEGYARAMQWLLLDSGMPNMPAIGTDLNGESHMWNVVLVDGMPYHLDVTWNDTKDLPRHNCFNLTTAELLLGRQIDDSNIGLPDCTATDMNFYRKTDCFLASSDRQTIARTVAREVQSGDTAIELQFDEASYEAAKKFVTSGNPFFKAVETAMGGRDMWSFKLYGDDTNRVLTMIKSEE